MILGTGLDITQIPRIEDMLKKFGESFLLRVFSTTEINNAARFKDEKAKAGYFAKRFAAKEAFAKAIGTGFRSGLNIKDISIENDIKGKPVINLNGKAKEIVDNTLNTNYVIHISMSDDYPIASAMVIIEKLS